jgi:hypothetical protein
MNLGPACSRRIYTLPPLGVTRLWRGISKIAVRYVRGRPKRGGPLAGAETSALIGKIVLSLENHRAALIGSSR